MTGHIKFILLIKFVVVLRSAQEPRRPRPNHIAFFDKRRKFNGRENAVLAWRERERYIYRERDHNWQHWPNNTHTHYTSNKCQRRE